LPLVSDIHGLKILDLNSAYLISEFSNLIVSQRFSWFFGGFPTLIAFISLHGLNTQKIIINSHEPTPLNVISVQTISIWYSIFLRYSCRFCFLPEIVGIVLQQIIEILIIFLFANKWQIW